MDIKYFITAVFIGIILILFLFIFAYLFGFFYVQPPINIQNCPDYWVSKTDSTGYVLCENVKDLGICIPPPGQKHLLMNFNIPPFIGFQGKDAKYYWANQCKVYWDGINQPPI